MIEGLKAKNTLKAAELQDGDIVCFQKVHEKKSRIPGLGDSKSSDEASVQSRYYCKHSSTDTINSNKPSDHYEDAKEYYDFLCNKRTVMFDPHPQKCDAQQYPGFQLVLNTKISYDRLAEKVGETLGVPGTHLRFYTVNATSGNPRTAVKRTQNQTLMLILNPAGYGQLNMNQRTDCLYFEVLDMSLAELDTRKSIKITLLSEGITKEVSTDTSGSFLFFAHVANLHNRTSMMFLWPRMASLRI